MVLEKKDKWFYTYLSNGVAGGATAPLMPLFVTEGLGGNMGHVGMVTSATSIASVPSCVWWGALSDFLRRRKSFVLVGFFGMGLSLLLMGLAANIEQFYLANFLLGMLATASAPVGVVLIIESCKEELWAQKIGLFSKAGGVGWVGGLILGAIWLQMEFAGVALTIAMRALFILGAILSFISMILAYQWIEEPLVKVERKRLKPLKIPLIIFERARHLPSKIHHYFSFRVSSRGFKKTTALYFFALLLFFTGFTTFYVAFPIFLKQDIGLTISDIFVVYLASSTIAAVFYSKSGAWVKKFGPKKMQLVALTSRIILFPSFLMVLVIPLDYFSKLILIIALHASVGFCWALISVAAHYTVSTLAPEGEGGEYLGLYNAIQGIGAIIGALFGGFLAFHLGFAAPFIGASTLLLVGILIFFNLKV